MRNYENCCILLHPNPQIAGSGLKNISCLTDTHTLMDFYLKGKSLVHSAMKTLNQIHKIPKQEINDWYILKLLTSGQKPSLITAALDYRTGSRLIEEIKQTMTERLRCLIHFVIRRKFSKYVMFKRDLFQEGVIGLLMGIDHYHPSKGEPVLYLLKAIENEIHRFIRTLTLI